MNTQNLHFYIVCVDDEDVILTSLEAQLRRHFGGKYSYEFANSAEEAESIIEEVENHANSILVVISDWLMPGKKGDEFLRQVHEKLPDVVTILLSGQAQPEAVERARSEANLFAFIPKPWTEEELISAITQGIGRNS